jgi:glutaredoxin
VINHLLRGLPDRYNSLTMWRAFSIVTTITLLSATACQQGRPPAPRQRIAATSLPKITVKPKAKMLFTFVKEGSSFETVDGIDKIPPERRGWVRVVDLAMKPAKRLDHELVYVADLRKPEKNGAYPYVVMSRRAFEIAAVNRIREGATAPATPRKSGEVSGKQVILYATSWCSACRQARAFLKEKGIPYVEKDIEKDPGAAAELLEKAKKAGISASGVPVLDVRGTLVQGFDPERLLTLLGDKR